MRIKFSKKKISQVALMLLLLAFCVVNAMGDGDFKVFLEAAKMVRGGGNPYNCWITINENSSLQYFYSPLWAILLVPFSYLPNFIPNIIWLVASLYFLHRIWVLLKSYINQGDLSSVQLKWILLLTTLMSLRFIYYNFAMIQMTIFLLWSILESMRLFKHEKVFYGAALLAFAINVKIMPVVIIPYLIYRRNFKEVIGISIFSLLFLLLPVIFIGFTRNNFLLSEWWSVINPSNNQHLMDVELGPHSLTAWIPTLLSETNGEIVMKRNILSLGTDSAIVILNITRLILVVFTVYFLRWPPFIKAASKLHQLRELAYITLIIPLIFPHMQKYAFVLAIPVLFYLSHFVVVNLKYMEKTMSVARWYSILMLLGLSFILMTLTTDGIVGRELNHITQHFKTITWGALLLVIAMVLATPEITTKTQELQYAIKENPEE